MLHVRALLLVPLNLDRDNTTVFGHVSEAKLLFECYWCSLIKGNGLDDRVKHIVLNFLLSNLPLSDIVSEFVSLKSSLRDVDERVDSGMRDVDEGIDSGMNKGVDSSRSGETSPQEGDRRGATLGEAEMV